MNNWQEAYVTTNGIRLHYWRTGGDKPPLVLCHGIRDNGLCWTRVALALEAEYDLILVDARGHGLSDKPAAGYSGDDHADDMAGVIEALSLDRPRVLGHSMGAITAATLACKRPDLVGRIVLEDPPWRMQRAQDSVGGRQYMAEWRQQTAVTQQRSADAIAADGRRKNPDWDEADILPWAQAKVDLSLDVFDFQPGGPSVWQPILSGISVPTLLLVADPARGAATAPETAQFAAENPMITVQQVDEAGHSIHRDRFDAFIQATAPFLAQANA